MGENGTFGSHTLKVLVGNCGFANALHKAGYTGRLRVAHSQR